MRNDVLERKIARIVLAIAQELGVSEEMAIGVFYATETYKQLVDPRYGLQLMSDGYILDDVRHRESVGTDPEKCLIGEPSAAGRSEDGAGPSALETDGIRTAR